MPNITTVYDQRRGCGWRAEGGLYLRSDGLGGSCGKMPIKLDRCQVCGSGVRVTRGLSRINPKRLFENLMCQDDRPGGDGCDLCPVADRNLTEKGWLIGVGRKYYTRQSFIREAVTMGISKRIAQVPRDLEIGKDCVYIAFPEAITDYVIEDSEMDFIPEDLDGEELALPLVLGTEPVIEKKLVTKKYPGVIAVFQPQRIEYVVGEDDDAEKLERMEKRGFTLVQVVRVEESQIELTDGLDHSKDY